MFDSEKGTVAPNFRWQKRVLLFKSSFKTVLLTPIKFRNKQSSFLNKSIQYIRWIVTANGCITTPNTRQKKVF